MALKVGDRVAILQEDGSIEGVAKLVRPESETQWWVVFDPDNPKWPEVLRTVDPESEVVK